MNEKIDFQENSGSVRYSNMRPFSIIFIILLLLFPALFLSCRKDPDPLPQKISLYLLLCPTGKTGCYGNCGSVYDTSGNGIIDPVELPAFQSCTSQCDVNCDTSFLYLFF
ncbi:MAG: hypothetical protein OEZ34_05735 [Spirochaetia bacterium]|nr:hypothetical protein [Spirochaetia bacterium]